MPAGSGVDTRQDDFRARRGVGAVFFVNGTLVGLWAANIPLVKEALQLDALALSAALFAAAFGALLGMPMGGKLIAHHGSAEVTRWSGLALMLLFPAAMLAPSYVLLLGLLVLAGFCNGTMDVAMNAHGALVERRLQRPVMSSFHGLWSLGGLIGSGLVWMLVAQVGRTALALGAGLVLLVCFTLAMRRFLDRSLDQNADGAHFALPNRQTLALGSIAFLGMFCEGAILDWSGVYLRELMASAGFAASGVAGFSASMAISRFFGDGLRARHGATALVRVSALISLSGLVLALLVPHSLSAALGFAVMGFGVGNIAPVVYGAAGRLKGRESGAAIASVLTMGYGAFLLGPSIIGFVAEHSSLKSALALVGLACVTIALIASSTEN